MVGIAIVLFQTHKAFMSPKPKFRAVSTGEDIHTLLHGGKCQNDVTSAGACRLLFKLGVALDSNLHSNNQK